MEEVNIYFVLNKKNQIGGKFYNVYLNRGDKIDLNKYLSEIKDLDKIEELVKLDDESFKKTGGIILKRCETIGSTTLYTEDRGGVNISLEQQAVYEKWMDLDKESNELYERLTQIQLEKNILSDKINNEYNKIKIRKRENK